MTCFDLQALDVPAPANEEWENRTSKTVPKPLEVCCSNAPKNQIVSMRDASPSFWSIPVMSSMVRNGDCIDFPWCCYESFDMFNQKFRKDESGIKQEGGTVFAVGLPDLKVRRKGEFVGPWDIPCEAIFDAFQHDMAPSIRWSSGLRRPYSRYDKETGLRGRTSWGALKDGPDGREARHCMVLDFDHVPIDAPIGDIDSFCAEHGFNGTIWNDKGTELSLSVPVHFSQLIASNVVHAFVELYGDAFMDKFGLQIDHTGTKGWMCKNIFMVERVENAVANDLTLEIGHKTWHNWSQARRDWKKHESWWFGFAEEGGVNLKGEWTQHAEIFHRNLVDPLKLLDDCKRLQPVFMPAPAIEKPKKAERNGQKKVDTQNSRQGYVFRNALPRIKKLTEETGKLEPEMKEEFVSTCEMLEKSSPEYLRRNKTMKEEGDDWIERYWKWCLKQQPEYWRKLKTKETEKGTLRRMAAKLLLISKFAYEHEVEGGDGRFREGYENLMKSRISDFSYIRKILETERTSSGTLATYRKTIRNWDGFKAQVDFVLENGTGVDFLDKAISIVSRPSAGLEPGTSSVPSSSKSSAMGNPPLRSGFPIGSPEREEEWRKSNSLLSSICFKEIEGMEEGKEEKEERIPLKGYVGPGKVDYGPESKVFEG